MASIGRRSSARAGLTAALALTACVGNPAGPPTGVDASRRPPARVTPTPPASTGSAAPADASPGPGGASAAPTPPGTSQPPSPAATASAGPASLFGLPAAQEAIAGRAAGRLLAVAQVGFAQNRGKAAVDGLTSLTGGALPVGIIGDSGGAVLSNNGGSIIANNGGGLISDLGGGLVGNNASYRLRQVGASPTPLPPPSLTAGAGETLYADRLWPDGRRTLLFVENVQNTDDQFRRVQVRAGGAVEQETRLKTLEKWPGGQVKHAEYRIADYYPDGTLRAYQAYAYLPDAAGKTLRVAMNPGESRVSEPATGVAVTFDRFEVDVAARSGAFSYAYGHLGAVESGTLIDVEPLANGQIPLTYDDPLGHYDGDATLKDAAGQVIYTKRQRRAGGTVTRTYDLQGGLVAELTRTAADRFEGQLRVDGAQAATLALESRGDGSVLFRLVFPEAPDRPVALGFGLASGASPVPTPSPSPAGPIVGLVAGGTAAGYADGDGPAAAFNTPSGLAASLVDPDRFYVADTLNHRIRTLTLTAGLARVGTLAGDGRNAHADGPGASASFQAPVGLAVAPGPSGGETVFVSDQAGNRIRRVDVASDGTASVRTLAGDGMAGFAEGEGAAARFDAPAGLAWDAASGLYVADINNHRIRRLVLADPGAPATVSTLFGLAAGLADGPAATARIDRPFDLALDAQRRLWIADRGNKRIRRVDLTQAGTPVSTVAGTGVLLKSFVDGPALAGGLNPPLAIAVDGAGRAYVTHFDVRVLTPAGVLQTLAGSLRAGDADGPAQAAGFGTMFGITPGPAGQVLVTDGHRVRAIVPPAGGTLFP